MIISIVWWVLVLGGLLPVTWFLVAFRPKRPVRPLSVIVLSLVLGYWIFYARSVAVVGLRGWVPTFESTLELVIRLVSYALTDVLMFALLIAFLGVRRRWPDWQPSFRQDDQGDDAP